MSIEGDLYAFAIAISDVFVSPITIISFGSNPYFSEMKDIIIVPGFPNIMS